MKRAGAAKPRERRTVSLYLSDRTTDELAKMAKLRGLERSKFVEALVHEEAGREWRLRLAEPSVSETP